MGARERKRERAGGREWYHLVRTLVAKRPIMKEAIVSSVSADQLSGSCVCVRARACVRVRVCVFVSELESG